MPEVTLLNEINCYEKPNRLRERLKYSLTRFLLEIRVLQRADAYSRRSVWLFPGRLDEDDSYVGRATRLVGPTSPSAAETLVAGLTRVLEDAGVTVHNETVVDD